MAAAVLGLHVIGLIGLVALVSPRRYGVPVLGIGVTAYTLGLRHAFDADHIAAIDNTTRKLMAEGKRPLSVGFWFSLGHSTIVFALALLISIGVRSLDGPVQHDHAPLRQTTSAVGLAVSGGFLYLIAALNFVILLGIARVFRDMRSGRYDEAGLERRLCRRGLMNRVFGRLTTSVAEPRHLYPVGLLFGLGFDTASEVALLVVAGGAAATGLAWYAVLCLPILFAAGMSLMDSIDGAFMSVAYGWTLSKPIRKVFYNLTVTALSVVVALVVGTIEVGGLASSTLGLSGSFWIWLENVDLNLLGFAIVAVFATTWVIAGLIWRLGRIEERWSGREPGGPQDHPLRNSGIGAPRSVTRTASHDSFTAARTAFDVDPRSRTDTPQAFGSSLTPTSTSLTTSDSRSSSTSASAGARSVTT
jgi:high-affinity nickel-transport protein